MPARNLTVQHSRLSRQVEMAGRAFGFEDVPAPVAVRTRAGSWLALAMGAVLVAGFAFVIGR